ncbi:hypothetical protein EDB19DRAFT_1643134 [Suillus lakei]|nr:hypothetical protein EDB19DRAFT_1643134 [Suillus lakei]
MCENEAANIPPTQLICLSDFNRHDLLWELLTNIQLFTGPHLTAASILLNLLTKYGLSMALEVGKPTLESTNTKSRTRLDNMFCSADMPMAFIYCDIEEENRPVNTDHFPIISILDLTIDQNPPPQ